MPAMEPRIQFAKTRQPRCGGEHVAITEVHGLRLKVRKQQQPEGE